MEKKTSTTEKFVNAVLKNKNVKAIKYLEKIIQKKCFQKIKDTLNA